ncbi:hypothetical protein KGQ20_13895 [Catenulispora sp. NF23]|uniref:hypothetical protein n=1 Tax=Catenulispora pinistramenti TaxID=2705254 RepID=UPI001BAA230B|nr:hypothetical protein [Catenulispora pinistramenti]MBS2533861.1 hypothetical protein [Catenulispora pinistramenti]
MVDIAARMEAIRDELEQFTKRPVTCDPRNVVPPCVLVEPPLVEPSGEALLCGDESLRLTYSVHVIGLPGAWAEFRPLSELMAEMLVACDAADFVWTQGAFGGYLPLNGPGGQQSEPSMAYTLTIEELV